MISTCEKNNSSEILKYLKNIYIDKTKPVVLLDADRTLCDKDTSRDIFYYLDLDWSTIKRGFKKHGYIYKGFKTMSSVLSTSTKRDYINSCKNTASNIELYPGSVDFLSSINSQANTIILTAGCGPIWRTVLDINNIKHVTVISGGHSSCDDFLIGREEKGLIANYLSNQTNKSLIAIGDSDVDTLMLQASDIKGIVVNHKNNSDLMPNLETESIDFQLSFTDFKHSGIQETSYFNLLELVTEE